MDRELALDLFGHVRRRHNEMAAFLQQLALLESPSSVPDSQRAVLDMLAGALERLGYQARQLPGPSSGGCLYARPSRRLRDQPAQLLLGHCDTVWPRGTLESMPVTVQDGTIKGPGVFDMKGGLTQIVFALGAIHELGLDPPAIPLVLVNSDEEVGSQDSTRFIRRLARVASRVFVLEPALGPSGKLKTARKGVGRFTVVVRSADSPGPARIILELSHVIQELFALNDLPRGITVNVGTVDGGLRPGIVRPEARAVIDVRVPDASSAREIEAAIHGLSAVIPGVELVVEGRVRRPPLERTPRNQALWRQAQALGSLIGLELEEGMAGGGSDGNTTSLYAATLDGLGAVGDGAHATHEFVDLDRMVERCALLALLLLAPVEGDQSPVISR